MAVVSGLASESYLTQKGLCLALELGPHTYVGELQLICRKGESANVKRVGLDNRSADQNIYTRLYEGLASGLKAQFDGIPFYYAHMRGADIRVECLLNGVYDMAVVSRLAAESYLTQKGLCLALELGPHTYVGEHQLICRKGESANVKRGGLDNRSADQKIMTDVFFGGSDVERVDLSYHESLQRIVKGDVDAVIWKRVYNALLKAMLTRLSGT